MNNILIIGAGPAGLMAAYELTKRGLQVTVLEARDRIGGRCFTYKGIEAGAEFVHGDLPILRSLLEEAGIKYHATDGEWVQLRSGSTDETFDALLWPLLMQRLKALKEDMSLKDFLTLHFADDKYAALKDQAVGYAEGYDTADTSRVSSKALYEEWASTDNDEQYRIEGGYGALMNFLANEVHAKGGRFLLSEAVTSVEVGTGTVQVRTANNSFSAEKVIIAMPLGVLQRSRAFQLNSQDRDRYIEALQSLGFGDIVKFILKFRTPFWEEIYPELGFLLSAAPIPTWWTQLPVRSNILTGWLGGRSAKTHSLLSEAQLRDLAFTSLAQIFSREKKEIEAETEVTFIHNWSQDPFTLGSYAYATVGYQDALKILNEPMGGRLSFAGEYMYSGAAMGTVEAALWSGREVSTKLSVR